MTLELHEVAIGPKGAQPLFPPITLTVPPGEVAAVMGPSGIGKPTLLDALGGHLARGFTPSGRLRLDGIDLLALMRTLLAEPRALLLDGPFSRLDATLRDDPRAFTFDHVRKRGIPALMVTHDPADAEAAGGSVIELTDGAPYGSVTWCPHYARRENPTQKEERHRELERKAVEAVRPEPT